jgi:DNA-3-methyladenine glycosylase
MSSGPDDSLRGRRRRVSMRGRMSRFRYLPRTFFARPADQVAPELLGRYLVRRLGETRMVARIVETEAYLGSADRASHAWKGRHTSRNASLYENGGVAYVYLIYGMHHCLNAVAGNNDNGEAVLIRGAEPLEGVELMMEHRHLSRPPRPGDVAGGPGKLCQALKIDRQFDGHPLQRVPLQIVRGEPVDAASWIAGPRIGIDYAGEATTWPLRFALAGNRHVSRPFPWSAGT